MPESGADIRFNPRLEKLIERARSISMPKEKIESAIKSGAGVIKLFNSGTSILLSMCFYTFVAS